MTVKYKPIDVRRNAVLVVDQLRQAAGPLQAFVDDGELPLVKPLLLILSAIVELEEIAMVQRRK